MRFCRRCLADGRRWRLWYVGRMNLPFAWRKFLLPFLLGFVLPLVAVYVWWGGFNPVTMTEAVRGPYIYAYMEATGDYSRLPDVQAKVAAALKAQGVAAGLPVTLLYSNPDVVQVGERRARTGYLLAEGTALRPPLLSDRVEARPVLEVTVQAGHLLAPSRAYAALDKHQQANGQGIAMPTLELYRPADTPYRMGVFSLEMPLKMPLTKPPAAQP